MKILGAILVAAVVALVDGCAKPDWIERTLVTVDVTGAWSGVAKFQYVSLDHWFELQQEGPKVKGSVKAIGGYSNNPITSGPVEGTVSGDRFEFRQTNGPLAGELTVSGDEMAGPVHGPQGLGQLTLRRVNSRSPQSSPKP